MSFVPIKNSSTFDKLKAVWNPIYDFVLGNKLSKIGKDEPIIPKPVDSEVKTDSGTDKQDIIKPYIPQTDQKDLQNVPNPITEKTPDGGAGGEAGNTPVINQTKYYPPRNYPQQQGSQKPFIPTQQGNEQPNYSGIKNVLGMNDSDNPNADYNTKLTNDINDYIGYASKFGSAGTPFINQAINTKYPMLYKQSPKYDFDKNNVINDNGNASMWNPTLGKFQPLIGKDGVTPLKYTDVNPDYTPPKPNLTPVRYADGDVEKVGFINADDPTKPMIKSDVAWDDYNENPKTKAELENKMQIAQMNNETKVEIKGMGKNGRSGHGNGTVGTDSNTGSGLSFQGQDLDYNTAQRLGLGTVWKNYHSGNKKKVTEAWNVLEAMGVTKSQAPTKVPNSIPPQNAEDSWKDLFHTQYQRAQNPSDPNYSQAVKWLRVKENQDYAKKLGVLK